MFIFYLKLYVSKEIVSWLCILTVALFAALDFVKYNGMTAGKIVLAWFKSEFLILKKLLFRNTNIYYEMMKQDKEKFVVPKEVQDAIPISAIYDDGIFKIGKDKYSKTFKFTDINYAVASREDKERMFLEYSELLNSFDSGATTKITINNRHLNRLDFENTILIPKKNDELDVYREEYNHILLENATGANGIVQDKYVTISINKKNIEGTRNYFSRVGADLIGHFSRLGSKCVKLETDERLRIIHDFFRVDEEPSFHFDLKETRKKGITLKIIFVRIQCGTMSRFWTV